MAFFRAARASLSRRGAMSFKFFTGVFRRKKLAPRLDTSSAASTSLRHPFQVGALSSPPVGTSSPLSTPSVGKSRAAKPPKV